MKFYHGTNKVAWNAIRVEGWLWGPGRPNGYRHTYLTPEIEVAEQYGDVILEVEWEPQGKPLDNYGFNPPPGMTCWQFAVFVPITLDKVKRIR
jgi:hypothetical protein